jgi:hypothetical protein
MPRIELVDLRELKGEEQLWGEAGLPTPPAHAAHLEATWGVSELAALKVEVGRELEGLRHVRAGGLDSFRRLSDARPPAFRWFAEKFGLLGLCATHLLPHGRCNEFAPWAPIAEPIAVWRHYARQAQAIVRIQMRLHQGRLPDFADWKVAYERSDWFRPENREKFNRVFTSMTLEGSAVVLTDLVNEWLRLGKVEAGFDWRPGFGPRFRLAPGAGGLFGALAQELAERITGGHNQVECFGCGDPFAPKPSKEGGRVRRPNASQRAWCPSCKKDGADARYRQREKRKRDNAE